jgi:hypothetical protein
VRQRDRAADLQDGRLVAVVRDLREPLEDADTVLDAGPRVAVEPDAEREFVGVLAVVGEDADPAGPVDR